MGSVTEKGRMTDAEEAAAASAKKTCATAFETADAEASSEHGPAQTPTRPMANCVSKTDDAEATAADFSNEEPKVCCKPASSKNPKARPAAKHEATRYKRSAAPPETAKRPADTKTAAQGYSEPETKATKTLARPPVRSQRRAVPPARPTIAEPKRPVADAARRADSSGRRAEPASSPATSPAAATATARPSAPTQAHAPPAQGR